MLTVMVAIIMPVYNAETFVCYSIESVLKQTFNNWELIVIDDGSTDKSAEVIKKYANRDNRIKYYYQRNAKQAAARNVGFQMAVGSFIAFLDSDDQWTYNHLELCLAELEKINCDIVSTGFYDSNSDRNMLLDEKATMHHVLPGTYKGDEGINQFLMANRVATSTVVMRREVIEKIGLFDPRATPAEDYDLWIRAIKNGFKVKVVSEATMYYRHHNYSSTSNNKPRWSFNEEFYVINKNFTKSQITAKPFDVKKSIARKFKNWVRFSNENIDLNKKIFYFWKFSGLPFDLKLIILFSMRYLRFIKDNRLNLAITSRLNVLFHEI
jgi:teichuronic acid biosynthesis glycosyltransferase TuaG